MKISKIVLVLLLMGCLSSCSEELDFGQYEDLTITPSFESSIFYIEAQESIINRIVGLSFFTQEFNFDAFEEAFFADRVLGGVITYELENTTSKDVEISIEFLDETDTVLDIEFFQMDAAPTALLIREVAYGDAGKSLDILRNTSKIRLSARNLGDNSSTSSITNASLVLRSAGEFMLRVK
jgi:hypothetical protein